MNDSTTALEAELPFQPDVILVDVKMPRMDGFELIRRLRDRYREGVRIVMLTGLAGPDNEARAEAEAADEFLSKPVLLEGLLSCVERQFGAFRAGNVQNSPAG